MNLLLALLSRDAAGLAIAVLVGALGWAASRGLPAVLQTPVALLAAVASLVLAAGSLRHLTTLAAARRQHPPPGRLVALDGHRIHIVAEGERRAGRPAVVWFAGGHASGLAIHHLHRAFREETRSILIDRPGTGWSDTGPFPRTTAREAEEMLATLERAGEAGPFVLAGHSFGGLLAANMARRRPELVHTLVLLDPTPLETIVFGKRLGALRQMRRAAWLGGLAQLFGIDHRRRDEERSRSVPAYARAMDATRAALGPEVIAARAVERNAGNWFAQASIYRELTPEGAAAAGWETVVYDHDLGDLPLWLVAPQNHADVGVLPEAGENGGREAQRMFRFYAATRERYMAASSRSRRVVAPAGSGHNFIYEEAAWTIGVLREAICSTPASNESPPA